MGYYINQKNVVKLLIKKKEKCEKIMAGTGLKTHLWYLLVTHRQKNHSGYFYVLCMQPNAHQHPSRKHPVRGKCPSHIAEEA